MNSPELKGSLIKRINKDEMNEIEGLHMRLSYSWLNSFVRKKSGRYNGREWFLNSDSAPLTFCWIFYPGRVQHRCKWLGTVTYHFSGV